MSEDIRQRLNDLTDGLAQYFDDADETPDAVLITHDEYRILCDALAQLSALQQENEGHKAQLSAIVKWLEREQADVFRRGIWDAINEATL